MVCAWQSSRLALRCLEQNIFHPATAKITLKTVDARDDDRVLATIIIEAATM